ncbi:SCO family protein [Caulobacter sp. 17J65-9]|uniref:SCO family protein n=1 Tax=Caulobacter sp. 17J65-9 TaxID=2709382 RepID=UPI0032046836
MSRFRMIFAAGCLALAALLGVTVWTVTRHGANAPAETGQAAVGGPFQLVDQNGRPQTEALLKGKWTAVFFGFTYCPDVCPTTLQTLAAVNDRLGPQADKLQILFVTVDPARDTPAQLKAYLDSDAFPRGVIGLTGTPAQIDAAAKAYRAPYAKVGEGPDYLMEHSAYVYLMGPDGRFVRILGHDLGPDEIAEQIKKAMREQR